MSFIRNKRQKRTLNHLEQNIVKGMNCPKTISQIIAFVLYCMALTHPYTLRVRGIGTENLNILTLGPFHVEVKDHICKLIASPELLLSMEPDSHLAATLDGCIWSDPRAHAACIKLLPTHPDVKPLLLAGLKGSLVCWEHFTSEFEEGGAIDLALEAKKDLGFMPLTNDANKGLLGMLRCFTPFMDEFLTTEADEDFLRWEACTRDESGVEKTRWAELTAHVQQVVDQKLAKDAENAEKDRLKAEHLASIGMKLDLTEINSMLNNQLKDQLAIHQRRGDKDVPIQARLKNKVDRLAALLAAVARFQAKSTVQIA
ncbi:hypothetical protein B0H17DRAFT_1194548 [Mycena rosella]|uniref:Uncharacterized protein n=1 Tax=Mycena rosella TaxID=1033263 RepID=A0AAD7DYE3_MYCRO|nr:hypothetical protein B0H17DRAFT_1194548 [Mycena rosella]